MSEGAAPAVPSVNAATSTTTPPARRSRLRAVVAFLDGGDPVVRALALLLCAYYAGTRGIFQGKASGDGFFGFMYLPGLFFHHTFDIAPTVPTWVGILGHEKTGHVANACPIGPVLFWWPTYLLGLGLEAIYTAITHIKTSPLPGQSEFDFWMAGLGSLFAGLAGNAFLFRFLSRRLGVHAARAGLLAGVLATPLTWYLVTQPLYQHACAYFAVTVLIERWDAFRSDGERLTPRRMALLGAVGGLAMLTRIQEAVWLLLPGLDAAEGVLRAVIGKPAGAASGGSPAPFGGSSPTGTEKMSRGEALRRPLVGGLVYTAVAFLVFAPQLLLWHWYFGALRTPQPGGHMRWLDPGLLATVFSMRAGLLPWSPVLYLVVPGLLLARRKLGGLALRVGLILAAELWVNASAWDHWGSFAFGARRFTDATCGFSLGIAGCWAYAEDRFSSRKQAADLPPRRFATLRRAPWLAGVLIFFIAYNFLLLELVRQRKIKSSGSGTFPASVWSSWAGAPAWLTRALDRYGYPFTEPAALAWSLAYHVPIKTFEGVMGAYLHERDCRIHQVINVPGVDFADPHQYIVEGLLSPADKTGLAPVAEHVRALLPLFNREPLILHLIGEFGGKEKQVRATWNHTPLKVRVAGSGKVLFDVPEAIVQSRSRPNDVTFDVPPGTRLKKIDFDSTTTWFQ